METKIERVARAICCPDGCKPPADSAGGRCIALDFGGLRQARAAVRELMEPDEAMVTSGAVITAMQEVDAALTIAHIHGFKISPMSGPLDSPLAKAYRAMLAQVLDEPTPAKGEGGEK